MIRSLLGGFAIGLFVMCLAGGCGSQVGGETASEDAPVPVSSAVREMGDFEVTARLVEIPEGAMIRRELYDYAAILKYEVLEVHRGDIEDTTIYIGQYNPLKPRREVADAHLPEIGGNVESFRVGQVHRMALEAPIDEVYLGGIVNKYFEQSVDPIYFAVWTDQASQ